MQIKYTIKTEPYETPFGKQTKIVTTDERDIQFALDDLTDEQRATWFAYEQAEYGMFGSREPRTTVTLKEWKLVDSVWNSTVIEQDPEFDDELTLNDAIQYMADALAQRDSANAECARIKSEMKAKREAEQAERKRREAERAAKREAERAARREAARTLEIADGKFVGNLSQKLWVVSELDRDHRFKSWIKRVDSVDLTASNGYAFQGEWVSDRTIELPADHAGVYLLASTTGSRKNNSTNYVVVTVRDGRVDRTDITADGDDRGWALTIRDRVKALVDELTNAPDPFAALREAIKTDDEQVTVSRELLAQLLERV